jgi:PAS domain S-box-containing protein
LTSRPRVSEPSRTSPSPPLRDLRSWAGPAITLLALAFVVAARPLIPIPSPGVPLLVTVAASAVLGGVAPGLVSAAIVVAFVIVDASVPGRLFVYDASQISRLLLNVGSAVILALMVGAIRQRLDTERERHAERRLAAHERALSETAADAMITFGIDGRIRTANPATETLFGYAREALIGRPVEELLAPAIRADLAGRRERYLRTGIRTMSWTSSELTGCRSDGSDFPIEVSIGENTSGERYFSWIIRDASERKALEEQLFQAQKMEAVGQLAGGVAHDFNNMLTAIGGFAELIRDERDDPETRAIAVDGIRNAASRAGDLTRQLLAFSRRQRLEPAIVSLNDTVDHVEPLLRRLLHEHNMLVIHRAQDLWPVLADPSQLETVVMNLAINARDAMPDGGTLTIQTANVELDELYAQQHIAVAPGPYAMLSVSDTGQGMDAETQARIFEPFFTTKEVGRGTGLGLSTVYGVIRQSGGTLWVYSEPGAGATFKIYLPRAQGNATGVLAEIAAVPSTGTETVLVAEDEPIVRELILVTLERHGYRVIAAADGAEALAILEREPDRIDLLMSDVVMPQMGGLELVARARQVRPNLPAILISGYSEKLLPPQSVDEDVVLLEKPFTGSYLARAVRMAIDRAAKTG